MKKVLSIKFWLITILISLTTAGMYSCIKKSNEDLFGPNESATCTDGFRNQGEYYTDCGGPCPQCDIAPAKVFFSVDRTWDTSDDSNYTFVSSDYVIASYNGRSVSIFAVDTNTSSWDINYSIYFNIQNDWDGVHEVSELSGSESYLDATSFVGQVGLETGVIEITNKDTINGWVSGRFKFNSRPDIYDPSLGPGHRVTVFNGEFKDIPLYSPVP